MRALVLSGGGSLGAFQSGVIKRLVTIGKEYDMYYGTSVGAINAAGLAQFDKLRDGSVFIEQLWKAVKTRDIRKHWCPFSVLQSYWKGGLFNSKPLREYIAKHLDAAKLRASGKRLGVCAVNLDTKKSEIFTQDFDKIVDAVIASAITPFFLDPIEIDGHNYLDGGIREVAPIQQAIDAGATEVDVIMTDPLEPEFKKVGQNLLDIGLAIIGIMAHEIANNDLSNAIAANPNIKITVIRPEKPLEGETLDFSKETIEKHIIYGYETAKKVMV